MGVKNGNIHELCFCIIIRYVSVHYLYWRNNVKAVGLGTRLFCFVVAATVSISTARAGQCPADKVGVDVTPPGTQGAKGVTDTTLTSVDLAAEPAAIQGRALRLRRLVIQPGGIVPFHSHANRPAIIYVESGTVTEYATTCSVPIVHRAGESTPEKNPTSHWWKNTGRKPAILFSADFFPNDADPHAM